MNTFNVICGLASIASLVISIVTVHAVYGIKIHIGSTSTSRTAIRQKANGRDNVQVGGDVND